MATDNEGYINSQFGKLVPSTYGYTIKITDSFGNSTNYLNLSSNDLTELQNILSNKTIKE